jgi:hypothetical protein
MATPCLSQTRIFVVLTVAEASAVVSRQHLDVDARVRGLAKIRTALEHATTEALSPEPSALPPLRAKDYRPRATAQHFRPAEPLRMAKATVPPARVQQKAPIGLPATPASALDDDYVPFRDEADGIYT